MYHSRTARIQAHRKQRQRKQRRFFIASLFLLGMILCIAAILYVSLPYFREESAPPMTAPDQTPAGAAGEQEPQIRLSFVGDIILTGHVETLLKTKGYDYPYHYSRSLFQEDDYTVANLETPVTKRGLPAANKEFVYKSPPEAIPALKEAGIDLVNLANNHSIDQGVEGLLDTFQILDENSIEYVGAGKDAERAYAPVLVERNGIRVAFFGFSRVVPEVSWYAGTNKPGVAATYDPARAVESIRAIRQQADLVVVIAHWGKEREDFPVDHQKELARAYIDAGADLVIGGHPHVLQGFESYQDKWIAYSLGNFIFTRSHEPRTWQSMVLQATCSKSGACELRMLPYHAELGQAVPMNEEESDMLRSRIESLSQRVEIGSDGTIRSR